MHFAYYEKNFACDWNLVVYHDDKPTKSVNGTDVERMGPFDVLPEHLDTNGEPMYARIAKTYPKPTKSIGE